MFRLACAFLLLLLQGCGEINDPSLRNERVREDSAPLPAKTPAAFNENRQPFFGDLHIHTGLSSDAFIMGVRTQPEDVYRFARGEVIPHGAGYSIQISRQLDFAAVTDHAEYMGQTRLAQDLDYPTRETSVAEVLRSGSIWDITLTWMKTSIWVGMNGGFRPGSDGKIDKRINEAAWASTIDAAEKYYQPGVFTSFIGYEWSATADTINQHLHRVVLYGSDRVSDIPFSSLDSSRPEDLWRFLEQENREGREAFAIPHNSNFSQGKMFSSRDLSGKPLSEEYARLRATYEPLVEIYQIKGSSETHPLLSVDDEFADFELVGESMLTPKEDVGIMKGSYVRDALRLGMELDHSEGFNPYKFGFIGASDSHNASSPSDEDSYTGKLPMLDGSAGLRTDAALAIPEGLNPVTRWSSGALTAAWAEENTRESIYSAFLRKETYATSGPRMQLRLFAGWELEPEMLGREDLVSLAYENGVPMGSTFTTGPGDRSPRFLFMALKDPMGANLDRIQIIKGWVDRNGNSQEKVFDVAAADDREADTSTGKLPAVGTTVDLSNASWENTIGGTAISAFWRDPEFDPQQQAFYYARLLQIPTPRWSTYDALTLGIEPSAPATLQERAVSSPIWYKPREKQGQ